jgi:hypothetical protein
LARVTIADLAASVADTVTPADAERVRLWLGT